MNNKIKYIKIVIYLLFILLFINLINITIINKKFYNNKLIELNNNYIYGKSSPRGRIYDRNHNLLVDNKLVLEIVYKDDYNTSFKDKLDTINKVINYIDLDYSKVTDRILKEYYIELYSDEVDNLITKEEYKKLKNRILNKNDIYNLKISRITSNDLNNLDDIDRKKAYLYYLMNNGYSYQEKIIKNNASDIEYAFFNENNIKGFYTNTTWERIYPYNDTFKSILGSVGPIPKEKKDYYLSKGYSLDDIVGLSNIELEYEDILKGKKAVYKKINNNTLELVSKEERGNDIVLSIDINLVKDIDEIVERRLIKAKSEPNTDYLNKTYVIIENPNTGEILALNGRELIRNNNKYTSIDISPYSLTDPMTPGSVIKGASMLVGYNEEVIEIGETMYDECIKLYNLPKKCSSHYIGKMNDIKALSESSNVYQFKIALKIAGIDYKYNIKGYATKDNFDTYRNIFKQFGLGVKTGIDLPVESIGYSGNKYTIDLLLNYAIGQYDTYTPIQLSQYISTIANNGERLRPHLLKEVYDNKGNLIKIVDKEVLNKVNTKDIYISRIQEGFRSVMTIGLGKKVMGNSPNPAGKTGTSETFIDTNKDGIIDTPSISQSFVGYAPYDNPKMSITVTSPDISIINKNNGYLTYVNRLITREISTLYFDNYDY